MIVNFCDQTTFHGINMIFSTNYLSLQLFWIFLSALSLVFFAYQFSLVMEKRSLNEKIVNVKLEFASPPFPAVTVCNLNPFKYHLANSEEEIRYTLDEFHQQVVYSEIVKEHRKKRAISKNTVPPALNSSCICQFDRFTYSAWPCRAQKNWIESICPECTDFGYCNIPNSTGYMPQGCFCYLPENSRTRGYCLLKPAGRMKRMWELKGHGMSDTNNPLIRDFIEEVSKKGTNMTDQVAIATTTREKLILKMSKFSPERIGGLGYGKKELILMGSFDGKQINVDQEFRLHSDPRYGNCFTFNWNTIRNKTMSRAGPSYGLRLMLFVNSSDYLPTTEATGVRLAIHSQDESPYPDTFGYSAPTGTLSSFGISLRSVRRLDQPRGICYPPGQKPPPEYFIYQKFNYEPEGCYRSCYQRKVVQNCKCADPRLPNPFRDYQFCDVTNPEMNECLVHNSFNMPLDKQKNRFRVHCNCTSPCHQFQYTTTYSVYYETLSYEILTESEAYSWVNLISDFGGQLGLWLGASVMSVFEFFLLLFRITVIFCKRRTDQKKETDKSESLIEKEQNENRTKYGNEYSNISP
ncbi:hypothetical protein WR25_11472 [Diploscapter pachys]|uniref:Uncharacterized protein n=1 Tax=Diploscapter pachys TaxID=2018661 RepID=A0A2A2J6C1_9BILA|nr:hypothetical protein WR25_11472 [Diploscapter pachys]